MTFEWQVPFIVIGSIALVLFFAGRRKDATDDTEGPPSGPELIERLQKTLGIAIVVESVEALEATDPSEATDTVTIRATFMSGPHRTPVVVAGPTESDTWAALAKGAIAWRNSDFQHVPMWWGSP